MHISEEIARMIHGIKKEFLERSLFQFRRA
jgi:hypothetical protein